MIGDEFLFFGADHVRDIFEDEDEIPDHADAITSCYRDMDDDEIDLEDVVRHMFGDGDLDEVIYSGDFDDE